MTPRDFICRFLGLIPAQNCNEETVRLLANVVDTTKDGLVAIYRSYPFVNIYRYTAEFL